MSTTLPLFWNLSSSSKSERIDASVKLIGALEQFQAKFTPLPPESSSDEGEDTDPGENISNGRLDAQNAPDVAYSIRRLVRGLASPRESSRLGFAVALTELLSRLETVSASQIISLITQASQIHGSMKGQEERDMLFARLFGITSLIRSGILFRSVPLSTSSIPTCTFQDFQDAMTMLLGLSSQKSFLREPAYWTFILSLRTLYSSKVEWKGEAWSWVTKFVFVEDKSWSSEKVGVALTIQGLGVDLDWKSLLPPTFKTGEILSSGSLGTLAKILMDVDIEYQDTKATKSKSSSVWGSRLHFVWNLILDIYFPPAGAPPTKLRPKASFTDFFKATVDDALLAPTSSDGRKLWGFEFFRLSLSRVPASELSRLFGPNFMRSWVNHLSKPDRYLHKAAKLVASSLPPVITANPSAGLPLLLQLLQTHGRFDRLTRTKTVESMLSAMDVNSIHEYVVHLGELARNPSAKISGQSMDDPTVTRIWVADQFLALIRNGAIPKADGWIIEILDFFTLHSLFGVKGRSEKSRNRWLHALPDPPFSEEVRSACQARLLSCLAELTSQSILVKIGEEKTVRSPGVASDGELWVSKVLHEIITLEKDIKHVVRLGIRDEEVLEEAALRDRTIDTIERMKNTIANQKEARQGAELLLAATLLYYYMNKEYESEQDIEACLNNVTELFPAPLSASDKKTTKKKKKKQEVEAKLSGQGNVEPINALVDTLIGYLEKSTVYLRVVANQVFGMMTGLVDKGAIDLILAQLERRDPAEEEEEEEAMPSSTEGVGGEAELDDRSSDSESDSSSGRKSDEEDEDIEEDLELRRKIEDALRINGIQAASEGSNEESGSSDDEVMDDDQMMQLDEQLADIFRSRVKERGRNDIGAQREATHFKNRVLDLVDIFLRKQPTSKYIIYFPLPLVQVIRGAGPDEKQLSEKVTALIRSRLGKARELPTVIDLPQTRETLEGLHALARKAHSTDIRDTISTCSLYLTRVLLSDPIHDEQLVVEAYKASLADFTTRKTSPLQPVFFQPFVQRHPRIAWQLRNDFLQIANKAVNTYRKCQTFQLLQPLLNQLAIVEAEPSEVLKFMRTLCQTIYATISDACDNSGSLNAAQVKDFLKLSMLAVRQTKRIMQDPKEVQTIWDAPSLLSLFTKLASSRFESVTSLHGLCKQLQTTIGANIETAEINGKIQNSVNQKKRKAEDAKEGDVKKARRKKVKKHRD